MECARQLANTAQVLFLSFLILIGGGEPLSSCDTMGHEASLLWELSLGGGSL